MFLLENEITPSRLLLHQQHQTRRAKLFPLPSAPSSRIERAARLLGLPVKDLQLALQLSKAGESKWSLAEIRDAVATAWDISVMEIVSARRGHDVLIPRQVAFCLSRNLTTHSLTVIGKAYGKRDHSTALHSVRRMKPYFDRIKRINGRFTANFSLDDWIKQFKLQLKT